MNLQQLRYLVATADLGSMTRAAAACHVGQPALTRAVRALEAELGVTVFVRSGRGLSLTPRGEQVVLIARRALAEVEQLEALPRDRDQPPLTIAATPTIQSDLGSGLVHDLWQRHPEVAVRFVHCESRQAVADAVLAGRADAGVTDLPASDRLASVPFEHREVVVLAPPGSDLPDPLPHAALADLRLIAPTRGGERRAELDALFGGLGVAPTIVFESDERGSWIPAVLAGVGCCLWYRSRGELAAGQGADVVALDPPLAREIAVVHRPGPVPPAVAALVEAAHTRAASAGLPASADPTPSATPPGRLRSAARR